MKEFSILEATEDDLPTILDVHVPGRDKLSQKWSLRSEPL